MHKVLVPQCAADQYLPGNTGSIALYLFQAMRVADAEIHCLTDVLKNLLTLPQRNHSAVVVLCCDNLVIALPFLLLFVRSPVY